MSAGRYDPGDEQQQHLGSNRQFVTEKEKQK